MKYIIKMVGIPCSIYTIIFLLSKLFIFAGELKWGLFSAILGLIGTLLQFPTSFVDLLITGYELEWVILVIGISYSSYWIYEKFN